MILKTARASARLMGRHVIQVSTAVGGVVVLLRKTFYWLFHARPNGSDVVAQMSRIGVQSFPVTSLTALFTGMVLALQTGFSFRKVFNEPLYVGTVVGLSLLKELGPVLTALVVAGRVGAARVAVTT